jgi:hypothetical protein
VKGGIDLIQYKCHKLDHATGYSVEVTVCILVVLVVVCKTLKSLLHYWHIKWISLGCSEMNDALKIILQVELVFNTSRISNC